jgi:hypothetical protein
VPAASPREWSTDQNNFAADHADGGGQQRVDVGQHFFDGIGGDARGQRRNAVTQSGRPHRIAGDGVKQIAINAKPIERLAASVISASIRKKL